MASIFKKMKQKKPKSEKTVPVKTVVEPEPPPASALSRPTSAVQPEQLVAGCGQSVGMQRDHNEDSIFTLTTSLSTDSQQLPFGLYIVADGMGGQQHGEVASGTAVHAIAEAVIRKIYLPLISLNSNKPDASIQEIILDGVREAHRAILKAAPGGGTTMTSVLVIGEQMAVAHIGDSRLYLFHLDGSIEVITRDHSLVKRLEELGQITAEEAKTHPQRNVLYRALGQGDPFDPDMTMMQVPRGASILICSDGLWGQVPQEKLAEIARSTCSAELACDQLVRLANEAGGPDNISAILVHLPV